MMRLGFHYHIPACVADGGIATASYLGLFLEGIAAHCEQLVLFLHQPRPDEMPQMDYLIEAPNVFLAPLSVHHSIPRRLLAGRRTGRIVAKAVQEHRIDLLLLRAPTPVLPFIVNATHSLCRHALLVVGDMREHLDNLGQPWWRESFVRQYIFWNESRQEELARNMLVFTNSAVFQERYAKIAQKSVLVRTTTLRQSDFFERQEYGHTKPFKLLYAGRIETGKGLLLIAEAIVQLNRQGIDCTWDIVGWSEPADDTAHTIRAIFDNGDMGNKITFHGKKKAGSELLGYYRAADAYIMASLLSEGFPRTIWEAMASSTPVIATPVGSIPFYLKHGENGLLVKPEASEIAGAIRQLAAQPEWRKKLAANALETARASTLEFQSAKMAAEIRQYLER